MTDTSNQIKTAELKGYNDGYNNGFRDATTERSGRASQMLIEQTSKLWSSIYDAKKQIAKLKKDCYKQMCERDFAISSKYLEGKMDAFKQCESILKKLTK